jgi:hypothetical protein
MPLPNYLRRVGVSEPVTLLAPHSSKPSDPSKGEAGNPQYTRMGVMGQVLSTSVGSGIFGSLDSESYQVAIKVNSLDFANPANGSPAYYPLDEIRVSQVTTIRQDSMCVLKAGVHFGFGAGNGVGVIADVASELAIVLNDNRMGIRAIVDPDNNNRVLIGATTVGESLAISVACFSYRLVAGLAPFIIEDFEGNLLFSSETEDKSVGFVVARYANVSSIELI